MDGYRRGVPLNTVIDSDEMSSGEINKTGIAVLLIVILNEMRSHNSTTLGSINGCPYNNSVHAYPWNPPPHAFLSVKEYVDYYTITVCSSISVDQNM